MPKMKRGRLYLSRLRKKVFNRDNGICQFCKSDCKIIDNELKVLIDNKDFDEVNKLMEEYGLHNPTAWTIHHIKPVSQGGTDELTNLQTLCQDCHDKLHNKKIK